MMKKKINTSFVDKAEWSRQCNTCKHKKYLSTRDNENAVDGIEFICERGNWVIDYDSMKRLTIINVKNCLLFDAENPIIRLLPKIAKKAIGKGGEGFMGFMESDRDDG